MATFTDAYIDTRIAALQVQLEANDAAIAKATDHQQYSTDTGQTRVMVQRQQISQLRKDRERILKEICMWENMKSTAVPSHTARPGW